MADENSSPDSSGQEKSDWHTQLLWLGFPVIVLIWIGYYYSESPVQKDSPFDRLNTLFSGLAAWGVVFAILLQKAELALQRSELRDTRAEVRGQKEQLIAQNLTLRRQRFENTFFSLLDLYTNLVSSMEFEAPSPLRGFGNRRIFKGRECFVLFYHEFQNMYSIEQQASPETKPLDLCMKAYEFIATHRQAYVGHYFRTLYNIVKFIEINKVENPQIYINILRAQLSSSELNLLFYNCLSRYGNKKFKLYVQQFGLLENMVLADLARSDHKDLYEDGAFKSPDLGSESCG